MRFLLPLKIDHAALRSSGGIDKAKES
jgi:hypothetical protein